MIIGWQVVVSWPSIVSPLSPVASPATIGGADGI